MKHHMKICTQRIRGNEVLYNNISYTTIIYKRKNQLRSDTKIGLSIAVRINQGFQQCMQLISICLLEKYCSFVFINKQLYISFFIDVVYCLSYKLSSLAISISKCYKTENDLRELTKRF